MSLGDVVPIEKHGNAGRKPWNAGTGKKVSPLKGRKLPRELVKRMAEGRLQARNAKQAAEPARAADAIVYLRRALVIAKKREASGKPKRGRGPEDVLVELALMTLEGEI